jgi:hypothetical protein
MRSDPASSSRKKNRFPASGLTRAAGSDLISCSTTSRTTAALFLPVTRNMMFSELLIKGRVRDTLSVVFPTGETDTAR